MVNLAVPRVVNLAGPRVVLSLASLIPGLQPNYCSYYYPVNQVYFLNHADTESR